MASALDELLLRGQNGRTPWKAECVVAATSNITRSGEQTIDGVSVVDGDRVLLTGQTAPKDNGVYVVATGAWVRAADFADVYTARLGTTVLVYRGTSNSGVWRLTSPTSGTVTPGVTETTWTKVSAFASSGGTSTFSTIEVEEYAEIGTTDGAVATAGHLRAPSGFEANARNAANSANNKIIEAATNVLAFGDSGNSIPTKLDGPSVAIGDLKQPSAYVALTAASSNATANRYHSVGALVTSIALPAAAVGDVIALFRPQNTGSVTITSTSTLSGQTGAETMSNTNPWVIARCQTAGTWHLWSAAGLGGGGGSYTAGDGLTLTGSDFDIDTTDTTVFAEADTASRVPVRSSGGVLNATGFQRSTAGAMAVGTATHTGLTMGHNAASTILNSSSMSLRSAGSVGLRASGDSTDSQSWTVTGGTVFVGSAKPVKVDATGALVVGGETATTSTTVGRSGAATTVTGSTITSTSAGTLQQNCVAWDVNATGAVTIDGTTVGIDGTGAMNLGSTSQTALTVGHTGAATTIRGSNSYVQANVEAGLIGPNSVLLHSGSGRLNCGVGARRADFGAFGGPYTDICLCFPAAVTPGSAAATSVAAVAVPASTAGNFEGWLSLRSTGNAKLFRVTFSYYSDATTVTPRDVTITASGTTHGVVGVVAADIVQGTSGLQVTFTEANGSGFRTKLNGFLFVNE